MEVLGKLFGSVNRVKIMRLFVLNPDLVLTNKEIALRSKITNSSVVGKEANGLCAIGFVSKKGKGKIRGWQLDPTFPYLTELKAILKSDLVGQKRDLARRFTGSGKVMLLVVSGVFIENNDSRADLLIVGDTLRRRVIDRVVKGLEAEIGKELNYAILDTADFRYRLNARDKFIRDVLDYPHNVIIDKIGL